MREEFNPYTRQMSNGCTPGTLIIFGLAIFGLFSLVTCVVELSG
jgi:hypothetical protein